MVMAGGRAQIDGVELTAMGQKRALRRYPVHFHMDVTVQGFNKKGDIIVDHGWVIDRDFGHLSHGYVVTSHQVRAMTVDKVFLAIASESLPATGQRTAYVAVTRGREQAVIYTDDRKELLKAMCRPDDPMSATELSDGAPPKPKLRDRLAKHLVFAPWA